MSGKSQGSLPAACLRVCPRWGGSVLRPLEPGSALPGRGCAEEPRNLLPAPHFGNRRATVAPFLAHEESGAAVARARLTNLGKTLELICFSGFPRPRSWKKMLLCAPISLSRVKSAERLTRLLVGMEVGITKAGHLLHGIWSHWAPRVWPIKRFGRMTCSEIGESWNLSSTPYM